MTRLSCTIYLYAANDPVIEASEGLTFAPFNIGYPKMREHCEAAGLDPKINKWELVFDFSPKGEANFKMLPPSEFQTEIKQIEGFEEAAELVFDYPMRYGGSLSDDRPESSAETDHAVQAHDIRNTSQAQAQQLYEQAEAQREAAVEVAPAQETSDIFSNQTNGPSMVSQSSPDLAAYGQSDSSPFSPPVRSGDDDEWDQEEIALMAAAEQRA